MAALLSLAVLAPAAALAESFGGITVETRRTEWQRLTVDTDAVGRFCRGNAPATEALRQAASELEAQVVENQRTPDRQARANGGVLFDKLRSDPSSPYAGLIDPPQRERERAYIERVGTMLLRGLRRTEMTYSFHVVVSDVPNAFALPGGYILVSTALIDDHGVLDSEAGLAGVLAHEIAHVDLYHTDAAFSLLRAAGVAFDPAQPANSASMVAALQMVRSLYQSVAEDAADAFAVRQLIATGYSPLEYVRLWRRWSTTHDGGGHALPGTRAPAPSPLETELRELLRTHQPAAIRACRSLYHTVEGLQQTNRRDYYVGRRNLRMRLTVRQQQF